MRHSKRVLFKSGEQARWLQKIMNVGNYSTNDIAKLSNKSPRTVRDWLSEKWTLSEDALHILSKATGTNIPKDVKIQEAFWYTNKAGKIGGLARLRKYGSVCTNEKYRKQKWLEWWNRKGKFNENSITKRTPVKFPRKSKRLAEFIGIMMGDGGISERQLTVSLSSKVDREYSKHVISLIQKLFMLEPSVYERKQHSVLNIVISRTELVRYFHERLGLPKGNKVAQQFDIPNWVKENDAYLRMCIRGLVDTDGCFFDEVHTIKGKKYGYKRLNFTSASVPLCTSVFNTYTKLGLHPKMRGARRVQLEKREEIAYYLHAIGTSNPKHLRRYLGGVG